MSDFIMQIGADLDLSKVQEQLNEIKNQSAEGVATGATVSLSSAFSGLMSTLLANPLILVAVLTMKIFLLTH